MIDIVIPFKASQFNNLELKYCLRSIEKHLTGYKNIYIIGDDPGFVANFIHIPAKDHGYNIQDNIRRKINIACAHPDVSDNFFFTNDDHIYLKPLNVNDLPYYYDVDLELAWRRKREKGEKTGSYKAALENTLLALQEKYYAIYHFDIHVPIIYNKRLFPKVMDIYDWQHCRWGFTIKSLYCNTLMIKGEQLNDMMIGFTCEDKGQIKHMINDRFMFAFNEQGTNDVMFDYLQELFPD